MQKHLGLKNKRRKIGRHHRNTKGINRVRKLTRARFKKNRR